MITGFNTDIEHNGIVYHVQTEDKGFETPLILSLVFVGGEILAAKRSPYDDLVTTGFDEKLLAERLQRQHRLICAAIKQGRVEDLKRMGTGAREAALKPDPNFAPVPNEQNHPKNFLLNLEQLDLEPLFDVPIALVQSQTADFGEIPEPPIELGQDELPTPPVVPARVLRASEVGSVADFIRAEDVPDNALVLRLLDDREYYGGDRVVLSIQVRQNSNGAIKSVSGAKVLIKVLGSSFRPIIMQAKTSSDGVSVASFEIPHFKTGRGAILIRATFGAYEAELRRIISYG